MICTQCEQQSDWPREDSQWRAVGETSASAVRPLLVCESCHHRQWFS